MPEISVLENYILYTDYTVIKSLENEVVSIINL